MSVARFEVIGTFDLAGGAQKATVLVDRATGIFHVRPYRRKKLYSLPLSTVAALVCQTIIRSEVRERSTSKRKNRHLRKS